MPHPSLPPAMLLCLLEFHIVRNGYLVPSASFQSSLFTSAETVASPHASGDIFALPPHIPPVTEAGKGPQFPPPHPFMWQLPWHTHPLPLSFPTAHTARSLLTRQGRRWNQRLPLCSALATMLHISASSGFSHRHNNFPVPLPQPTSAPHSSVTTHTIMSPLLRSELLPLPFLLVSSSLSLILPPAVPRPHFHLQPLEMEI